MNWSGCHRCTLTSILFWHSGFTISVCCGAAAAPDIWEELKPVSHSEANPSSPSLAAATAGGLLPPHHHYTREDAGKGICSVKVAPRPCRSGTRCGSLPWAVAAGMGLGGRQVVGRQGVAVLIIPHSRRSGPWPSVA